MKKILLLVFTFIIVLSCTKMKKTKDGYSISKAYIKEMDVWGISDESDFGKKISDINDKINLFFGDPVTIIGEKKINDMNFYRITVKNDKKEYWLRKDYTASKFIVITDYDTIVYELPIENYTVKAVLQPGDFGTFLKSEGDWMLVDFWAYREKKEPDKKEFIGKMWIKKGGSYTENTVSVKKAYFLYYAYYYFYTEKNINVANNFINKALEVNISKKKDTEITRIIKEFQEEINK